MTETYDRAILQTLQEATTAAVTDSSDPNLPVAHQGVGFTVPNDQKYLEVVWIPNNNDGDFWGSEKNYRGLFRLILHWPKDGAGVYTPMDLLASILSYFDKGKNLQNVQIYEKPDTGSTVTLENEILYPATIKYQCFRQ